MSNTPTENIMTRNPVTCSADESMNAVAQRMWEHDVGAIPVTDGAGRAIGMITDRDITMAAYTQGVPLQHIEVRTGMSKNLWTVRPQAPLSEVERLMQQHQVRRITVVDDGGRPVGMVSLNDLARRTGSSRNAAVTQDELTQTVRAVCQPRSSVMAAHAAQ
ncbi:CBS domain-containing protein [Paraliomyxa miuraensis]|uniref:CBS domain-containing protein n=1 Tax=Paraliomyxa miuraensis TaxID=376150 RepID=UPI0022548438|nr:CBS domain-containing protein [Paraliomyxa miuraensis]MCX4243500.1 CBS domain-containing protein [Paraliomyxa miuraensis]